MWLKLCRFIPGLYLLFHSSTCLFLCWLHSGLLLLRLCNRIWGWLLWLLQHWFGGGLKIVLVIWLPFSFHIYFRIGFSFYDECYWDFHGSALNLQMAFCKTVNSFCPWAQEVFPRSAVFFNCFLHGVNVFVVEIFYLSIRFISWSLLNYCELDCFLLDFFLSELVIGVIL